MSEQQHAALAKRDRARIELQALGRCMKPHAENSHQRKLITIIMVVGWLIWSFGLAQGFFEAGPSVYGPFTIYQILSLLVMYAFARLHDLEVENLLPMLEEADDEE